MIVNEELLRMNQVIELVHIARSTVWLWVKTKGFPKPFKVGKCTFWRATDINTWIEKQARAA